MRLLLAFCLALIGPSAAAYSDAPRIAKTTRIHVINQSSTKIKVNYPLIRMYLGWISEDWKIYKGDYYIYLVDAYPAEYEHYRVISYGFHVPGPKGPVAYVDVPLHQITGGDIHLTILHEVAEMAVNPNLDFFDKDGNMVEIADDVTGYYLIGPHLVPIYHLPSHFNLYGRRG